MSILDKIGKYLGPGGFVSPGKPAEASFTEKTEKEIGAFDSYFEDGIMQYDFKNKKAAEDGLKKLKEIYSKKGGLYAKITYGWNKVDEPDTYSITATFK